MTALTTELLTTASPQPAQHGSITARRNVHQVRTSDVLSLVGAAIAAISATALVVTRLSPLTGILGMVVLGYAFFLLLYGVLVAVDEGWLAMRDRLASVIAHSLAVLLLTGLVFIVVFTVVRGLDVLPRMNFYREDLTNAGPLQALSIGGVLHAIVGTLEQITLALLVTVPLGLVCAVFLNTSRGRFPTFTRTIVEAMTALPSIVAGLFIYATVILMLGFDKSGFAASLALSVMMLPIIIRAADVVLRLVPGSLLEASYALGASQWRTLWTVTLPTARSGLTTAIILGTARGIGETSPVLLTAGYTATMNRNPFSGPQVSLPLATFELVRSPQPSMIARGFGSAALLMFIVLLLFIVARVIGGRGPGRLSPRGARAATRASRRDVARYAERAHPQPGSSNATDAGAQAAGVAHLADGPQHPTNKGTS
jgi:phosphate transport system permease protein